MEATSGCLPRGWQPLEHISTPFLNVPPRLRREQEGSLARLQARDLVSMVAFADAQPARIAHLHYPELTEDPIGACERALCAVGADGGPPFALRAQAFLERQRKGARAAPPAVYDDFGYEHEQVLSTPEVAAYCRRFGVQPERQRRTGT